MVRFESEIHFETFVSMDESEGLEARFANVFDYIDAKSLTIEKFIKARLAQKNDQTKENPISKPEEIASSQHLENKMDNGSSVGNQRKIEFQTKFRDFRKRSSGLFDIFSTQIETVWGNLPFIIPSIVIFQTAMWLAFLSDGSISGDIVQNRADGFGDVSRSIAILLTIFGAIGGYLLSSTFDNNFPYGEFSIHPEVVDVMVILLVLASILYLLKNRQSLYYLHLVIFGSVFLRLIEVNIASYNFISIILQTSGLVLFSFFLSSPILRYKKSIEEKASTLDASVLYSDSTIPAESSYHDPLVDIVGISMEQAPVSKPKRPSRRSEYELYEWVLLLANLILWPSVVIISIVLGSGTEVAGGTYNLEKNYLMLFGPLLLTIFFFVLLYRMDSNARDGSLYQAEKQSYLDEMEKYLEARTAYLELVTLQAQTKKEEIVATSSEE